MGQKVVLGLFLVVTGLNVALLLIHNDDVIQSLALAILMLSWLVGLMRESTRLVVVGIVIAGMLHFLWPRGL
jgi:hypothetical protein